MDHTGRTHINRGTNIIVQILSTHHKNNTMTKNITI
jgi:hypothetical protein